MSHGGDRRAVNGQKSPRVVARQYVEVHDAMLYRRFVKRGQLVLKASQQHVGLFLMNGRRVHGQGLNAVTNELPSRTVAAGL